jgi:hypothetical protein
MTSREKRFHEILDGRQTDYRFADVRDFLVHYGFKAKMRGTSHVIFRKESYPHIPLVVHHNRIKGIYVKRAVQLLKAYEIIS